MNNFPPKSDPVAQQERPPWITMIQELTRHLGASYSVLARHIGVAPSTIQKLATRHHRKPRQYVFHRLLCFYHKIFTKPYRFSSIKTLQCWDKPTSLFSDKISKSG